MLVVEATACSLSRSSARDVTSTVPVTEVFHAVAIDRVGATAGQLDDHLHPNARAYLDDVSVVDPDLSAGDATSELDHLKGSLGHGRPS